MVTELLTATTVYIWANNKCKLKISVANANGLTLLESTLIEKLCLMIEIKLHV